MGEYTGHLKKMQDGISPLEDNYVEKLIYAAKAFRGFGEALDSFLLERGFEKDISNVDEKVSYIKEKFREAGIETYPRDMKKWFTENKKMEKRSTAFQFCFAFSLNLEECEDFFKRICLQRGFDCHSMEEAVYYYAIKNDLRYREAHILLQQIHEARKGSIREGEEVLFTDSIIKELEHLESKEALLLFLESNREKFSYNNATAFHYINKIWDRIAGEDGIAQQERKILLREEPMEKVRKKPSSWDILLQIFGLLEVKEDKTLEFLHSKRTLKPILKDNQLMHPLAAASFPDRQGLEGILRGEHKSYELVRKMIILLVFYQYWTSFFLKKGSLREGSEKKDAARGIAMMNRYLVDAGYPVLYEGNPYDWIFLYAMKDAYPMETFRDYMRELYLRKEGEFGKGQAVSDEEQGKGNL